MLTSYVAYNNILTNPYLSISGILIFEPLNMVKKRPVLTMEDVSHNDTYIAIKGFKSGRYLCLESKRRKNRRVRKRWTTMVSQLSFE